ncbi:MAG: pseudouridine synthase [Kiritimatiellaeota bacterium]|nr:pseudouridine synthase [Kiritimatiellota bacterium]
MDSPKQNRKSDKHPRLHKYLAACGLGSRRACEGLIADGRVSVDGKVVREQGVCIDPARQAVCLDQRPVASQAKIFLVLNKPRGFLCTARDPQGRRTFLSLLPPLQERVFTVGRLDRDSEGLLLVTNDGDLAHTLMHPRHGVEKIYRVWTATRLTTEQERRLRTGVTSQGERLYLNDIRPVETQSEKNVYQVRLVAGRNRHIRRMFEVLGIAILRLQRVAIGPLTLDHLRSGPPAKLPSPQSLRASVAGGCVALRAGAWRHLKDEEVQALRQCVLKPLHSY